MTELAEITVTANASVSKMPDGIRIDMSVLAQKMDYAQTLDQLNYAVAAINASLKDVGISDPTTTQSYEIKEIWSDPYDDEKRKFQGYRGTQKMAVTIGVDKALLGRAIMGLASCKGNPRVSIAFIVKNTDGMEKQARLSAARRAREAATDLAEAAGLRLVSVKSINFTSSQKSQDSGLYVSDLAQYSVPTAPDVRPDAISHSESVKMIWLAEPTAEVARFV